MTEVPPEVPFTMLIEETDGYTMGQRGEERVKRTHRLFVDDLSREPSKTRNGE